MSAPRLLAPESLLALLEGMVAAMERPDHPRSVGASIEALCEDGTWRHGTIHLEFLAEPKAAER